MRVIHEDKLRAVATEPLALEAAARAFAALAGGRVRQPPPWSLELPDVRGEVHAKGAALEGAPVFALKVATGFYDNPERGLPTGSGLVLVFDSATGFPLALFEDGGYLTELRTGAAGALAVRLLAPERVERMAVIGTGVQARFQLRAISRVRDPGEVWAWSPEPDHVRAYCDEMEAELGLELRAAGSAEEAVREAGLVVTVTPARSPVVRADWLRADATVVAVGSDGPDKQELEAEALARADKVVTDLRDQCARLGELHHAVEGGLMEVADVHADLGQIVLGEKPGREGAELIVCDLTGVGAQDAALAEAVWEALG